MDAPVLRATAKTHKKVGEEGIPKSRPIVGASKGLTTPLGELLSDLIEPVSRMNQDSQEAMSTEEVLRKITDTNKSLREERVESIALGSMDVVALYPSIDQVLSAKIVAETIIESEIEYVGVDMSMAGIYLATIWTKERLRKEGILHLMPRKRSNRGRKATICSKILSGPIPREVNQFDTSGFARKLDEDPFLEEEAVDLKWERFNREYTAEERRILIAKTIQAGIEIVFTNHIYWYHSELYQQLIGGAIGSKLTGVVARIVMDRWERLLRDSLKQNKVKTYIFAKYVDDVNLATSIITKGYKRTEEAEGRRLTWSKDKQDSDLEANTSDSERTLELIREEADKLIKGLRFTVDSQEKNKDNRCPMLNLKV